MASITSLSLSASPQVVPNRASFSSKIGLGGPRAIALPSSGKSKGYSPIVVRAQKYDDFHRDFKVDLTSKDYNNELGEDLLDTSRFELTPWDYKEELQKVKMWFNMPGVAAQDIRVYVKDNKLFVQGKHLHLPPNVRKEDIKAKLGNGVLYVSVPKIKPDFEPLPIVVQPVSW